MGPVCGVAELATPHGRERALGEGGGALGFLCAQGKGAPLHQLWEGSLQKGGSGVVLPSMGPGSLTLQLGGDGGRAPAGLLLL